MRIDRLLWPWTALAVSLISAAAPHAGCRFDPSGIGLDGAPPDAPVTPDAAPDALVPDADPLVPDAAQFPDAAVPDADVCLPWPQTPTHFDPCTVVQPTGGLRLDQAGTYAYDTGAGTLTAPDGVTTIPHASQVLGGAVRLVSVDSFYIDATARLRATGPHPLLIASWSTIDIEGSIDVSSDNVSNPAAGAGAGTGTCNAAGAGGQNGNGGGGGGGGGFGGDGGIGGAGDNSDGTRGAAGTALASPPAQVRGGCPGAKGGWGDRSDGSGAGRPGGGAVQLTAKTSITISGVLHAGGAGGGRASGDIGSGDQSRRSGGGGGGSGGLIGLEAPSITLEATAVLAANGGGGGGGCDGNAAQNGSSGAAGNTAAQGGNGEGQGGDGGDGSAGATLTGGPGQSASRGGGGGAGGAGFILTRSTAPVTVTAGAIVSPPATVAP